MMVELNGIQPSLMLLSIDGDADRVFDGSRYFGDFEECKPVDGDDRRKT